MPRCTRQATSTASKRLSPPKGGLVSLWWRTQFISGRGRSGSVGYALFLRNPSDRRKSFERKQRWGTNVWETPPSSCVGGAIRNEFTEGKPRSSRVRTSEILLSREKTRSKLSGVLRRRHAPCSQCGLKTSRLKVARHVPTMSVQSTSPHHPNFCVLTPAGPDVSLSHRSARPRRRFVVAAVAVTLPGGPKWALITTVGCGNSVKYLAFVFASRTGTRCSRVTQGEGRVSLSLWCSLAFYVSGSSFKGVTFFCATISLPWPLSRVGAGWAVDTVVPCPPLPSSTKSWKRVHQKNANLSPHVLCAASDMDGPPSKDYAVLAPGRPEPLISLQWKEPESNGLHILGCVALAENLVTDVAFS